MINTYNKNKIDEMLEVKQDKLIAGANITITDNVISTESVIGRGTGTNSIMQLNAGCQATYNYSIALGQNAKATVSDATAIGVNVRAGGNGSIALGSGSNAAQVGTVAIGNGATATGHSAVALGRSSRASGYYSFCAGENCESSGQHSVSFGYYANAKKDGSFAAGHSEYATPQTFAYERNSFAFGSGTVAGVQDGTNGGQIAMGDRAKATAANTVALGNDAEATEANTVSVGKTGALKRIVHMADGIAEDDAVTFGQIKPKEYDYTDIFDLGDVVNRADSQDISVIVYGCTMVV